MASTRMSGWGTWEQTKNVLVQTLGMNMEGQNAATPGSTEAIAYAANVDTNIADLRTHAITGLRMLDEEIATGATAQGLRVASADAKREANRIRQATRKVEDLIDLTGTLTQIVMGIRAL